MKKWDLRLHYLQLRENISEERRKQASTNLCQLIHEKAKHYKNILSFAPLIEEIDIKPLNFSLCKESRLLLPKVTETGLKIFRVSSWEDLTLSKWRILEPDPEKCSLVRHDLVDCVLVPGVCFDHDKNRIGFGKGFYDQLLKDITCKCFWGVGFKEQLHSESLPVDKHDIKMHDLFLF